MTNEDLIYRFLKSRSKVNKNADILTDCIKSNRGIDAVELDNDCLKNQQDILNSSNLSYYLLNINNHIVLLYPEEERDKYMSIRDMLMFHDNMKEYIGFSYAEADVIKDVLDMQNIEYKVSAEKNMEINFLISEKDSIIMDKAIDVLVKELETDIGNKYLTAKNLCWANSIGHASKAIDFTGVSYIGSEGGANGMRIDSDGVIVSTQKGKHDFISRKDPNFSIKVINSVLYDLNGKSHPVKRISGKLAEELTHSMMLNNVTNYSKDRALKKLGLNKFPDLNILSEMKDKDLPEDEKEAVYALIRMSICRQISIEEMKDIKITKADEKDYLHMHKLNINNSLQMLKDTTAISDSTQMTNNKQSEETQNIDCRLTAFDDVSKEEEYNR